MQLSPPPLSRLRPHPPSAALRTAGTLGWPLSAPCPGLEFMALWHGGLWQLGQHQEGPSWWRQEELTPTTPGLCFLLSWACSQKVSGETQSVHPERGQEHEEPVN